jgi:hypothetical protein
MRLKNSFFRFDYILFFHDKRVFDEYKSVGSAWHKDSIITFDLPELDSTKRYDLFINLRDNNYQYTISLIVFVENPTAIQKWTP